MLIDSHCHLDAAEFGGEQAQVIHEAVLAGVQKMVVPAVSADNFAQVIALGQHYHACYVALGWHPMYLANAKPEHMHGLSALVAEQLKTQNKLVAIGEIGLDLFATKANLDTQVYFFIEQLKIAQRFDLPVILHVRRAIDEVLKYLRRYPVRGGIAHAFNGSLQQAEAFQQLGFKLGFGGAMTYDRALKIRALAQTIPLECMVLETDAPDIPPAWLGHGGKNSPKELIKIASVMADLRGLPVSQIIEITGKNCLDILPKMADLCTPLKVLH
jgi:TatD DNase family protein